MTEGRRKLKDLAFPVKGAGEMAAGVAHPLARPGLRVWLIEIQEPLAVRRGLAGGHFNGPFNEV